MSRGDRGRGDREGSHHWDSHCDLSPSAPTEHSRGSECLISITFDPDNKLEIRKGGIILPICR